MLTSEIVHLQKIYNFDFDHFLIKRTVFVLIVKNVITNQKFNFPDKHIPRTCQEYSDRRFGIFHGRFLEDSGYKVNVRPSGNVPDNICQLISLISKNYCASLAWKVLGICCAIWVNEYSNKSLKLICDKVFIFPILNSF